jgi:hypothetical protein
MRTKAWLPGLLLVSALLLTASGCNRQNIRGTPAQIDQVITKLDLIDQRVASLMDNLVTTFFIFGLLVPFLLPFVLTFTDKDYMPIGRRCLWGAIVPSILGILLGVLFALYPPAWKYVGIDPLYVKVVDATTNTAQKAVLTADQTQNVLAMRRQAQGYLGGIGKRGVFVLENPFLLFVSLGFASIFGALVAYFIYRLLPNIYSAARRHQKSVKARA